MMKIRKYANVNSTHDSPMRENREKYKIKQKYKIRTLILILTLTNVFFFF